ncbi:MAG TPA: MFS transporter, partial [Nevskiaceae bacterium]|nr:MFS transporter [Nevskiaceae bacterium]
METMAESSSIAPPAPPLSRGLLLAFCLPALMMGFMHAPEGQVQGIYAKHGGLPLAAIAGAMLFTRFFDAVTFPLIGYLSDATMRRTGSRKPWMIAGAGVTVFGLWFLYHPPAQVSIEYFTGWMLVSYVGWKLTEIPYGAWAISLTSDYVQRARVQMWRAMLLLLGGTLFYTVPYAAKALGLQPATDMNFATLGLNALVIAVAVPLVSLIALSRVPDGEGALPQKAPARKAHVRELLRAMATSRPLLRLLGAAVPVMFLNGMSAGATYLYVDAYMGLGDKYAMIQLIALPCSLLGLPFWGWLCLRYERHRVWACSMVIAAVSYAAVGFAPVGAAGLPVILLLYPATVFCVGAITVALPAMMGDVLDHDRLHSGEDRAGMYSAMLAFIGKSLGGVAGAAGIAVLAWFGFDATAKVQSSAGAFGIRLVMFWLPAAGFALGALLAWTFPITRARQAEIHAAL